MAAEIDVGKQVAYALLGGLDGFGVGKQVGYAELAYPHVDIAKQVGFAELSSPGVQVAKQVVYGLLKTYPPLDFALDLLGELTLQATLTDPSARFTVDFVGEGLLGLDLTRFPPFDCRPESATVWSVAAPVPQVWAPAVDAPTSWACADDELETHNDALLTVSGDFLVTRGGKHIRLITHPTHPAPPPVVVTPPPTPSPPAPSPPTPPLGSVAISTAEQLWTMLNAGVSASGGKTYILAAADFGAFYTPACDFTANPIVIQGQAGTRFAALGGVQKGVTWRDFNVYGGDNGIAVTAGPGCAYLTFDRVTTNTGSAPGDVAGEGYLIRNADHITVIGAGVAAAPDISGRGNGFGIVDSTNISISGMTIANNGVDGVIISGSANVTLDGVLGYDFHSDIAGGDHPDFIQTFGGCDNITVTNCGWLRGTGTEAQGYFFAETSNLKVANCWTYGGMLNALSVAVGTSALFDNNFLQGFADYGSRIIVRGAYVNATVSNNYTGAVANYAAEGVNPGFSPATLPGSNTIIGTTTAGDYAALDAWLAAHPSARRRPA